MNKKQPIKKFAAGAVNLAIWENQKQKDGKQFVVNSVSIERRYLEGENWKSTNSFGVNDLQKIRLVVDKAQEFLFLKDIEESGPTGDNQLNVPVEEVKD